MSEIEENIVAGRNAVIELLRSDREIETIFIAKGTTGGSLGSILNLAKKRGIPIKEVPRENLEQKVPGCNHQGVLAFASAGRYYELTELLDVAKQRGETPFLLICDEIEDPHNFGAIIRTAEAAGVHGIIIPKRRGVGLNYIVSKTASGALEHMRICRVSNLVSVMEELKKQGIWIYGADMNGEMWCGVDYSGPMALVIGSEGKGIGRLVRETCDFIVSLPMFGKINSLNASVAAGIIIYEAARQHSDIKPFIKK